MTPQLKEKESLIAQIEQKDVLLSYPFENIKSFTNLLYEAARDDSVAVSYTHLLYCHWGWMEEKWMKRM